MKQPTPEEIAAGVEALKSQIPPMFRHMASEAELTACITVVATAILNAPSAPTTGA
jgi:hypothetical protein